MVTLDSILDEAKEHPSRNNTTILATDQFCTIRGPAAIGGSEDPGQAQKLNADDGRSAAPAHRPSTGSRQFDIDAKHSWRSAWWTTGLSA